MHPAGKHICPEFAYLHKVSLGSREEIGNGESGNLSVTRIGYCNQDRLQSSGQIDYKMCALAAKRKSRVFPWWIPSFPLVAL